MCCEWHFLHTEGCYEETWTVMAEAPQTSLNVLLGHALLTWWDAHKLAVPLPYSLNIPWPLRSDSDPEGCVCPSSGSHPDSRKAFCQALYAVKTQLPSGWEQPGFPLPFLFWFWVCRWLVLMTLGQSLASTNDASQNETLLRFCI